MPGGETTLSAHVASAAADDVRAAHTRWWDALLHADVVVLDTLLAHDLTFHSPYGTVSTKAEFIENLRSGRLGYDSITAREPLARLHGEAAIVTGQTDIHFHFGDRPRYEELYYAAVYGWTPTHWHISRASRPYALTLRSEPLASRRSSPRAPAAEYLMLSDDEAHNLTQGVVG